MFLNAPHNIAVLLLDISKWLQYKVIKASQKSIYQVKCEEYLSSHF